ncbi:hypothetical protein ACEPPN_003016 [Leptodophora sp. 'Broadleaf-Isolate-01']
MAKSTPQIKHGGSKKGKKKSPLDARIARIRKMPKYKTPAYMSQEARIQAALAAYENLEDTDITSLRIAAGVFRGVSYSTLNSRYKKSDSSKTLAKNGGHNKKLNKAQEAFLIWYIDTAIERGFPMRYDMIVAAATMILNLSMEIFQRIGQNWARR